MVACWGEGRARSGANAGGASCRASGCRWAGMREPDRRRLTRPRAPCPCIALLYGDSEKPAESGGSVAPRAATRKVACTCDQKPCSCPKADVNYAFLHATGKRAPAGQDRSPPRRRLTPRMVGAGPLRILRGIGRALGPGTGAHREPGPPSVSEQRCSETFWPQRLAPAQPSELGMAAA